MKRKILIAICLIYGALMYGGVPYVADYIFDGKMPQGWTQQAVWYGTDLDSLVWMTCEDGVYFTHSDQEMSGCATALVTEPIDMGNHHRLMLSVRYRMPSHSVGSRKFTDSLAVYYQSDASAPWLPLCSMHATHNQWTDTVVPLIGADNRNAYRLALVGYDQFGGGISIARLSVYSASVCQPISGLSYMPYAHSAVVAWSGGDVLPDTRYQVCLSSPNINAPEENLSEVFWKDTDVIPEQSLGYTISGLASNSSYRLWVRSTCSDNASGYVDWVDTMLTTALSFPYQQDFESFNTLPYGWQIKQGQLPQAGRTTLTTPYYRRWIYSSSGPCNQGHMAVWVLMTNNRHG